MKKLKIKKECIGLKVKCGFLNKWYIIEEGNEELYWQMGIIDIFEKSEPAIVKKSKDVKNRKKSSEYVDSNGLGIDNDSSPILSI
jgi:hypothetical protein